MISERYVIFVLGLCLGVLLTTIAANVQPRRIELKITEPMLLKLDPIEEIRLPVEGE